ncbi:hypothetical protein AAG906_037435 [Vitis piasezkii]
MIVKSRDRSDHLAALERFFERIAFRLRLNPKKCTFGVTSGKLLGYMVSERGIEVDPDKIRAILDMPAPRTEREVRDFLGRLQYISRFIARLTDICEPIFRLLRKSQPTVWDDQCQRAFERIIEYLLSPPVLAPPTPGPQLDDSGKDRAIYYLSKRMLDYETRYVMIERYCLALVWATRRLRHYMTEPALVGRLMRWLVLLTEFDIHYVTQKSIRGSIVADHLASLPVSDARAIDDDFPDEDVAAVTSLSGWRMCFVDIPHGDHIPVSIRLAFSDRHPATNNIVEYEACILGLETALELGIRQMEVFGDSNLLLVGRFDDLRYTHLPRAQNQFADALATLASMIDIPVDATIRPLLIESRYAPAYCCLIDDTEIDDGLPWTGYFWLTMETDCCQFVQRCPECQIHGDLIHVPPSELHALTSPWPFSVWGIDIIGKISPKSSNGHEFILVAIDYFTKWVEAASYARLTSSELLVSSDHTLFVATSATPYSLVYGMEAVLPVEIEMGSLRVALEQQIPETDWAQARFDQLNLLDERRLRAETIYHESHHAYQRKMARAFKKRVKPRPLHVGDLVLKVIRGLIRDPRGKFRPNWSGPYFIRELTPEGAAWLMDLDGNRFSEPTNVDQLKRYYVMGSDVVFDSLYLDNITCSTIDDFMSYVACSMIDDSMLSDLRPIIHFDAIQGHISIRMRFIDHEGVACLSLFGEMLTLSSVNVVSGWSRLRLMDSRIPWRRLLSRISVTVSITRPRYIVFASLTIIPELFINMSSQRSVVRDSSAFRAIIGFQIDIQSRILGFDVQSRYHFSFRRSEPSSHLRWRSVILITFRFGVEPSSLLGFGVQSHHRFRFGVEPSSLSFWRSEPSSLFSFGVQGHHYFQFWRSEPSPCFQFGVQSRYHFLVLAFRAVLLVWRSEPLFHSAFRAVLLVSVQAIIHFPFGVQSHICTLAFRAVIHSQFDVRSPHIHIRSH